MSRLENVIESMVEAFEEYAATGEKKHQIDMEELKQMLEKEVEQTGLKDKMSSEDLNEAMEVLDKNHDGEVNFREFSRFVASLAKGYYKQKRGKGKKKEDS